MVRRAVIVSDGRNSAPSPDVNPSTTNDSSYLGVILVISGSSRFGYTDFPQIQAAGQIGSGIDLEKKNSIDCCISEYRGWETNNQQLYNVTLAHLVRYIRKFPYLVCGALAPMIEVSGQAVEMSAANIDQISDEPLTGILFHLYRPGSFNLQKYRQGVAGYHHWHSEIYPREQNCETLYRVALFMFFLNDVAQRLDVISRCKGAVTKPR